MLDEVRQVEGHAAVEHVLSGAATERQLTPGTPSRRTGGG
jgi:hypothetical protein